MKILTTITLTLIILGLSLSSLYAQGYDIPDPAFRKVILKHLHKPYGELTSEDYKEISRIEHLFVSGEDVKSIEGIQNFTSLDTLFLFNLPVIDLSPATGLKNLQNLTVSEKSVTDLSCLSELKNLKSLSLWDTQIEDFSPLMSLANLLELNIETDRNIDTESLGDLKNLESLTISWGYGDFDIFPEDEDFDMDKPLDVRHISNLSKLKEIYIDYPKLVNYESLSNLKYLKTLRLSSRDKLNLSFLSEMHSLEALELNNSEISDLKPLAGLDNLESIRIEKNNLTDISPLFDMKGLTEVSIALNSDSGDVIKDQLKSLEQRNVKAKELYLSNSILTLRALGSSELAFQDENPEKNFGTWDQMWESEYIQQGYTTENIIDDYKIVVFEITPSEKNEAGEIIKEATFKIVAVPLDPSSGLEIYAIDESQIPKVWIGDDSQWDINNIDLKNQDQWMLLDD